MWGARLKVKMVAVKEIKHCVYGGDEEMRRLSWDGNQGAARLRYSRAQTQASFSGMNTNLRIKPASYSQSRFFFLKGEMVLIPHR